MRPVRHKNKNIHSQQWTYALGHGGMATMAQLLDVRRLLGQSRKSRPFTAPIVWSQQREMLEAMRRFRAAVLRSAVAAQTGHSEEVLTWYARSLALSDDYIERLARAIDERPQGKGGWNVMSQLGKLYEEFAAHHDNPPAGFEVEVESRTMFATDPSVSETLFSKD